MAFYTETVAINQFYDKLISRMKANGWAEQIIPTRCTPLFTAAANGSLTVSATNNASGSEPWKAFDGSLTTNWTSTTLSSTNVLPFDLKIDFGSGGTRTVAAYAITARSDAAGLNNSPRDFALEGSNDGTNWTPLEPRITGQINWTASERRYFTVDAPAPFRHYRLNVSAVNGGTTVSFCELELFESPTNSKLSGNYDSQMTSTGSTGTDAVNLVITKGSSKDVQGNHIGLGIYEAATSVPGVYKNLLTQPYYFGTSAVNPANYQVNYTTVQLTYYLDVTPDRVYFATVLDPSANSAANNACYIGMMKRYSGEGDNGGLTLAVGINAASATGSVKVMRNRNNVLHQDYPCRHFKHDFAPSSWGDVVFVSPVFLEGSNEGVRGELEGVYMCRPENIVNEDEIVVGTAKYKAIALTLHNNNAFPVPVSNTSPIILFKLPNA